jgi:hypothetical protein
MRKRTGQARLDRPRAEVILGRVRDLAIRGTGSWFLRMKGRRR